MIKGIGTDLCAIERIANLMEKHPERFINRILTPEEQAAMPVPEAAPFLAKRFAAKEAIAKALGCGIGTHLSFQDITITRNGNMPPQVKLSKRVASEFPHILLHLSITQESEMALAFAIAENL